MRRRLMLGLLGAGLLGGGAWWLAQALQPPPPIRVGILHSLTGTMAISETPVVDGTLLAIEEINARGGVLGRRIEPVMADGRSDGATFAREAERLIGEERVVTVFGCWTSDSRKSVRPVFEQHDHLLLYPVQYEGLERSPNIVYLGAAPNQQIVPAVKWCFDHLGKRFFLVGSDYVFPRAAHAIIRDLVKTLGGQVVGEEYLLVGSQEPANVVAAIARTRPDVILNTINGDSNVAFFRELRRAGITPAAIPTMSFSVAEEELQHLETANMVGDYAAWNYFQSLDTPANRGFVDRFRKRYGAARVTSDPVAGAYTGVHLWAQAAATAGPDDVRAIRRSLRHQSWHGPEGVVSVDPATQHVWKTVRIGRITAGGQFEIQWTSAHPIRPMPYPLSRFPAEWETFLGELYQGWGQKWANPGPGADAPKPEND